MTDTHLTYDRSTARPAPFRGPFSELWRFLCWSYLKILGWRFEGDWPAHPKMVVVAAPHTSNWDGINMLAAVGYYRVKLSWIGKKSLTTGPFGGIVKWLGCVPVDRQAKNDVVDQMRQAFEATDRLILAVPPEGTRSRTEGWKSGFYHIARVADVPIMMSVLDYGTKTIRLSGEFHPTGDYKADLAIIRSHYAEAKGKREDKFAG